MAAILDFFGENDVVMSN